MVQISNLLIVFFVLFNGDKFGNELMTCAEMRITCPKRSRLGPNFEKFMKGSDKVGTKRTKSPLARALIHWRSLHLLPYSIAELANQHSPHRTPARENHVNSAKLHTSHTSLKAAAYRRNGTNRKYEAMKGQSL